ncbi:hypothetical protein HUT16_17420 [Kitasatospora sp. NA04385]|uniref:hypothetical protein n=1 Tax=Kitasatospora sp. NA04385 TaxID=2742135 RepID=UPI0015905FAF|nr:hypothetical protein [Kitasatospora sp. NA04385]QKW20613.1 hypothetical protein HUT16_17420 [Kitasatospora sp. NA04385]
MGQPDSYLPERLADALVDIRPAYLAPPTLRSTAAAARTLSAARWRAGEGRLGREFHHPRSRSVVLVTAFSSERPQDALIASGPGWHATFSALAPDEVLAYAAAGLVDHAENGPDGADPEGALAGLAEAGWSGAHRRAGMVEAIAPDALAELRWGPDEDTGQPSLQIIAGSAHRNPWYAELRGSACPAQLTEAVLTALASPAPARRRLREVPVDLLQDLDITPTHPRAAAATAPSPSAAARAAALGAPILSSPAPLSSDSARRAR